MLVLALNRLTFIRSYSKPTARANELTTATLRAIVINTNFCQISLRAIIITPSRVIQTVLTFLVTMKKGTTTNYMNAVKGKQNMNILVFVNQLKGNA